MLQSELTPQPMSRTRRGMDSGCGGGEGFMGFGVGGAEGAKAVVPVLGVRKSAEVKRASLCDG